MTHAKRAPQAKHTHVGASHQRDNVLSHQRDNSPGFVSHQRDNSRVPPAGHSIDKLLLPPVGLVRSFRRNES
jgi:hypothetical protein